MQPRGGHLAADNGNFSELYQPNDANEFGSNRPYDLPTRLTAVGQAGGLNRLSDFGRGTLAGDKWSISGTATGSGARSAVVARAGPGLTPGPAQQTPGLRVQVCTPYAAGTRRYTTHTSPIGSDGSARRQACLV